MAEINCPGQDLRYWKLDDIYEVTCVHCGALIEFFLILWAFHVVGDSKAAVETQIFVDTVEPIPFIRS